MPGATRSSQAATVRAIVEPIALFYALLSTFPYLPASDILTPPAAGWPQADIVNFRKLGKTDLVVEVLKHVPYIRTDSNRGWRLGYDDTKPITYVKVPGAAAGKGGGGYKLAALEDGVDHAVLWDSGLGPHGQKLDAHVVALTNGLQYGAWLLLDTEAGTITDFSLLGGISSSIRCPQSDRDAGLVWKHFPSKPINEFFRDWEEKYTSLEWIPIQDKNGREGGEIFSQKRVGTASEDIADIQRVFMDYGWGSAGFRKEECRKALSEWDKAREQRIVAEHDRLVRANRRPSPPDPLDDNIVVALRVCHLQLAALRQWSPTSEQGEQDGHRLGRSNKWNKSNLTFTLILNEGNSTRKPADEELLNQFGRDLAAADEDYGEASPFSGGRVGAGYGAHNNLEFMVVGTVNKDEKGEEDGNIV
ncbi:hypothetical protein V494_07328 [Pseudogymnoascus sp. VKM F-4513 (FW-928)]|nr:hypothetical protein V494_07328 [Pseudogymnoascus sp. VKM F-4513 (FW-928)]